MFSYHENINSLNTHSTNKLICVNTNGTLGQNQSNSERKNFEKQQDMHCKSFSLKSLKQKATSNKLSNQPISIAYTLTREESIRKNLPVSVSRQRSEKGRFRMEMIKVALYMLLIVLVSERQSVYSQKGLQSMEHSVCVIYIDTNRKKFRPPRQTER